MARALAPVVAVAVALAGCGTMAPRACEKTSIVVAQKDERTRVEERRGPPRVTATGTVEETKEIVPVREYWLRDQAGTWHRVSEAEFRTAAVGQSMDVCR